MPSRRRTPARSRAGWWHTDERFPGPRGPSSRGAATAVGFMLRTVRLAGRRAEWPVPPKGLGRRGVTPQRAGRPACTGIARDARTAVLSQSRQNWPASAWEFTMPSMMRPSNSVSWARSSRLSGASRSVIACSRSRVMRLALRRPAAVSRSATARPSALPCCSTRPAAASRSTRRTVPEWVRPSTPASPSIELSRMKLAQCHQRGGRRGSMRRRSFRGLALPVGDRERGGGDDISLPCRRQCMTHAHIVSWGADERADAQVQVLRPRGRDLPVGVPPVGGGSATTASCHRGRCGW